MYFIEKVLTPVLSSIVLALFFTYTSDFEYFKAVFFYSLIVFSIGGTICSYLVEYCILEKINISKLFYKYAVSVILFCIGGMVSISIFVMLQGVFFGIAFMPLVYLGVFPALIYYHLNLLVKFVLSRFVIYEWFPSSSNRCFSIKEREKSIKYYQGIIYYNFLVRINDLHV